MFSNSNVEKQRRVKRKYSRAEYLERSAGKLKSKHRDRNQKQQRSMMYE